MSTARSEHLTIGNFAQPAPGQPRSNSPSSSTSPIEPTFGGSSVRSPFGMSAAAAKMSAATRSGAGSPSHDLGAPGSARFLPSKRAREIQAQEGVATLPLNPWGGPPTSGNSTPLRENIPESPTDGFPDFAQLPTPDSLPSTTRRARAGTVPSRFPPAAVSNGLLSLPSLSSKTSRPSPSHSPFKTPSPGLDSPDLTSNPSALLSRLRAGSMPQRSPFAHLPGTSSPFGPSFFSSWNPTSMTRERGSTLASIASAGSKDGPSSPTQSQLSKEGVGENDAQLRTLDYLGLAETTPKPPQVQIATPYIPTYSDFAKQASRFRSYSVNNKDKYADEEDDDDYEEVDSVTRSIAHLQNELAATHAAIHNNNMVIQAFNANHLSRPRARTVDAPPSRALRNYLPTPSRLDNSVTAADMQLPDEKELFVDDLTPAVAAMNLGRSTSRNNGLEEPEIGPTNALWLGNIPTSTTSSTLTEMFKPYGRVDSARVLTHKNCGFVNFETTTSASAAKLNLNGKEIFPGAGPIRINYAKPQSASNTPGPDGAFPSPSPDPFAKGQDGAQAATSTAVGASGEDAAATQPLHILPTIPPLSEMQTSIVDIVKEFGATPEEAHHISGNFQQAIQYDDFVDEIPPIKEPTSTRTHDAPRLRDIRKRIDNQSYSKPEIEGIAQDMLPEIAELSSDYLGNTVVQKLFEQCSNPTRDAMLAEIAPHMAEIGVHKNGTWAAQKIIDVCTTPEQWGEIVKGLRPYTVPLFLDQYGNYVLQCCLKFGAPYNDFIFETMLSKMWVIAQGRYGARAMRACLESHHASKDQQRMLAAAIALHSSKLATNANGALLLTWFLDTCTFPQRRTVLAPQLAPYLYHLCTHKVAYLTVLKVINQKSEPDARDSILTALFFTNNDRILEPILRDTTCGVNFIFKVLTTPFLEENTRGQVVENVKAVLVKIKATPNQGYKRLMDEVGLPTRNGSGGGSRDHSAHNDRPRPASRAASSHQQQREQLQHQAQRAQQQATAAQFTAATNGQFYNTPPIGAVNPASMDAGFGITRSDSVEPPLSQPQYAMYGGNPGSNMYSGIVSNQMAAPNLQQLQYPQRMMQTGGQPVNNFYPPMQPGFPQWQSPSPSLDQFRAQNLVNGSPIQPPQGPFAAPGYPVPAGMGGYGYGGMNGMQNMQNMQYMPESSGNPRRGRVGRNQSRNHSASPRPTNPIN